MPQTAFAPGDGVVYRPYPGAPAEDGVVTALSTDPTLVFVRYRDQAPDAAGKATRVADLQRPGPGLALDPVPWVEVVTRYGGRRHLARRRIGDLVIRDRWHTVCRGTSAWTLESWAKTPDHPLGLTVDDMAALPACEACEAAK